ncbi:hypothetical protein BSM4216_1503 [Bacillus smithii]|nr:hypothetical protein BSM4216_1503 [Bacillus smithii]
MKIQNGCVEDSGLFTLRMKERADSLFANKGGTAGIINLLVPFWG